jgi:hypothetical protein
MTLALIAGSRLPTALVAALHARKRDRLRNAWIRVRGDGRLSPHRVQV